MTLRETLISGYQRLCKAHIDSYQLDAELLLAKALFHPGKPVEKKFLRYVVQIDRRQLFTLSTKQQNNKTTKQLFEKLIQARVNRVPVAYLTNVKEFCGLPFYIDKRVLIPRPQTERLVEITIQEIRKTTPTRSGRGSDPDADSGSGRRRRSVGGNQKDKATVIDVGTGSGCIVIALAHEILRHAQDDTVNLVATETSSEALTVAKRNARIHEVFNHIRFYKTNSLPPIKTENVIIVANLPYLDQKKKRYFYRHSPELKHEPASALFAGKKGLEHYFSLLQQLNKIKKKHISCFFEIDPHQRRDMIRLLQLSGFQSSCIEQSGIISAYAYKPFATS